MSFKKARLGMRVRFPLPGERGERRELKSLSQETGASRHFGWAECTGESGWAVVVEILGEKWDGVAPEPPPPFAPKPPIEVECRTCRAAPGEPCLDPPLPDGFSPPPGFKQRPRERPHMVRGWQASHGD